MDQPPDQPKVTRRAFAGAAVSAVALTVLGCDNPAAPQAARAGSDRPDREKLATEPFAIGPPDLYKSFGVYTDFRKSHGVWVVSTFSSSGVMIVALSAICTHNACGTRYNRHANKFKCPCHGSSFTSDGLVSGSGRATRALERCRLDLIDGELVVNPDIRFRQDQNEWSNPYSMHIIDSPEHRDQLEEQGDGLNRYRPHLRPTNPFID